MAQRRYRAFISYSHRDAKVAGWLHHALETYRLPKGVDPQLAGSRLNPIFKDREELPAADSLGDAIEQAIAASDALIVLCSPDAAKSPWIAKEIDAFKRRNGDRNVFPVIVEGEPPDNFPPPLLVHYEDGEPTDRAAEPIAADLRAEGDGRKLAKLKLVSGLTGVHLDALVQRDAARKQKRTAMVAAASLVGMVSTSALALYAVDQRDEAREQRAEADGLIEYMLTDLREQLEPVGRLEVLDGVGKRAMDYYARQKLEDLSDSELGRRARATMLVAEVQNLRGNNADALPAFEQAARTTEALLARDPDDPERMFNHGQSLFWVGYVAWQQGDMKAARDGMEAYADISTRLAAKDRSNLDWQMEEAYSLSNLGTMDFEEGKLNSALDFFERSLAQMDAISEAEGGTDSRQLEVAELTSWVSTTLNGLGRVKEAIEVRNQELGYYSDILSEDPANNRAKRSQMYARSSLGRMQMQLGRKADAQVTLNKAIDEAEAQIAADPDNTFPRELIRGALRDRALLAWVDGDRSGARRDYERAERLVRELQKRDPTNREWNVNDPAAFALQRALTDRSDASPQALRDVANRWRAQLDENNADTHWMLIAASLIEALAMEREGENEEARSIYDAAANRILPATERVDYYVIALRAAAAERGGDQALARKLRRDLELAGVDPLIDDRLPSVF